MKLPQKKELNRNLSKLFNVVVNYYKFNSISKVGKCTDIYTNFFRKNPNGSLNEAKRFYLNYLDKNKGGRERLFSSMEELAVVSFDTFVSLEKVLIRGSKENNIFINSIKSKKCLNRKEQYKNILIKFASIFYKNNFKDSLSILKKILWG